MALCANLKCEPTYARLTIARTLLKEELAQAKTMLKSQKARPDIMDVLACCNQMEEHLGGGRARDITFEKLHAYFRPSTAWGRHRWDAIDFLRLLQSFICLYLRHDDYSIFIREIADPRLDILRDGSELSVVDMLNRLEKATLRLFNYQMQPRLQDLQAWHRAHPLSIENQLALEAFCNEDKLMQTPPAAVDTQAPSAACSSSFFPPEPARSSGTSGRSHAYSPH
jgi:hypothetical protein